MSVNVKRKGARGELDWASKCREHGYNDARRGVQYDGSAGNPDVVGLPYIHAEVKRVEDFRLYPSLRQSIRDAREGEVPIIAHRKNRHRWVVVTLLSDWTTMDCVAGQSSGFPLINPLVRDGRLSLYDALDDSRAASVRDQIPIVVYRLTDNEPWVVIVDADDWFTIYREWEASKSLEGGERRA
jgi:Holliday junction resolvase